MICCFILLYLLFCSEKGRAFALSAAVVVWTLILFAMTEIFSCFHIIRQLPLLLGWAGVDLCLLCCQWKSIAGRVKQGFSPRFFWERKEWFFLGLIGMAVLVMALRTVPYNWDSQTYHLPRIMHWAQNGSVEHYATNILRQVSSPVLAEFVNLHVYVLTGRDLLFNLLQCVSFLLGVFLIYEICGRLGGGRESCFLSALLYLSMPIGFAEALTTQVDLYAALMLLVYVRLLMELIPEDRKLTASRENCGLVVLLSLSVAFGYLIKPSVLFGMLVFAVWLLLVCIRRRDALKEILRLLCCAVPCLLAVLIPEFVRNYHTFHALASAGTGQRQLVGTLQPSYLLINFMKNLVYNLPVRFWKGGSETLAAVVGNMADLLGVELNASSISEDGRVFALHSAGEYRHDMALNPLIVWLFLICIVLLVLRRLLRKGQLTRVQRGFFFSAAASFLVFCMFLRWEPFVSRYMTSYLALLCPLIAVSVQELLRKISVRGARCAVFAVLVGCCLAELLGAAWYHVDMCRSDKAGMRPVGYFASRGTYHAHAELCQAVTERGCRRIGLYMTEDSYEYPLWRMLVGAEEFEHVGVTNETQSLQRTDFVPDCIISTLAVDGAQGLVVNGCRYKTEAEFGEGLILLLPEQQ